MQENKLKDEIPSLSYTIQSCMKILAQIDLQELLQIYELSKFLYFDPKTKTIKHNDYKIFQNDFTLLTN